MKKIMRLLLTKALALTLVSCSHHQGTERKPNLIGGAEVTADIAPSSIFLLEIMCSGVLIAPHIVLTAGHCIQREKGSPALAQSGSNVTVQSYEGLPMNNGRRQFETKIIKAIAHPSWLAALEKFGNPDGAADDSGTQDIGVIILDQKVPVQVAKIASADQNSAQIGQQVLFTGGGCEKEGNSPFGHMKFANLQISKLENNKFITQTVDVQNNPIKGCEGDSGGPAYLATGTEKIVLGVISTQVSPSVDPSGAPVFARVDSAAAWIATTIDSAPSPQETAKDLLPANIYEAIDRTRRGIMNEASRRNRILFFLKSDSEVVKKVGQTNLERLRDFILEPKNSKKTSKDLITNFH